MLTEWVGTAASTGTRFAWVSLDANDAEPARFWRHVIAAIARAEPTVGLRSMAALKANPDAITRAVLPVLFEELSTETRPTVLILDDYHRAENSSVDAQLEEFLRYRPRRLQLVVGTRSDPAIGVARLRASGELVEVRAESLRFDATELSAFFRALGVMGLSEKDERRLAEQTGGWPAPLRLAALLMPQQDRGGFIDSFTGGTRQVVDYLTGDVLDLLPVETRDFLLRVSVLRRMCGPLCDAVLETSGSGDLLAELERANLFVSADVEGQWYQQHQLFAGALRLELVRTMPEQLPLLHVRAAEWFAAAGRPRGGHRARHRCPRRADRLAPGDRHRSSRWWRRDARRRSGAGWRPWTGRRPRRIQSWRSSGRWTRAWRTTSTRRWSTSRSRGPGPRRARMPGDPPWGSARTSWRASSPSRQVGRAEPAAHRAVASAPNLIWEGVALAGLGQAQYLNGTSRRSHRHAAPGSGTDP